MTMRIYFEMTVRGAYSLDEEPEDMDAVRELLIREHVRLANELEWLLENNSALECDDLKLGPE
jgi:hypothetical protein